MKNLRKESGITLVALVVTIIVLLILAGVSLSLVAGSNGILEKASGAVTKNEKASVEEQVNLEIAALMEEYYEGKYVGGDNAADAKASADLRAYIAKKHATTGFDAGKYKVTVSTTGAVSVKDGETVVYTAKMDGNGAITNFEAKLGS